MESPPPLPLLSANGLRFIQAREGFRSRLYNDSRGFATIGYGHLVHKGPVGTNPRLEAPFIAGISQVFGSQLMARDLAVYERAVRSAIKGALLPHQWDACISLAYNIGDAGFMTSTLVRRINAGATPEAIRDAFMLWTKNPELVGRRKLEVALFLEGKYG